MSSFITGQQRHLQQVTSPFLSLVSAVILLTAVPGATAQESAGPLPGPNVGGASARGVVEVTFVDPFGISAASDLLIGAPDQVATNLRNEAVASDGVQGGNKAAVNAAGPQVPASLTVTAAPHQPISIVVDDIVPGEGYSLSNFRCNYNAGDDTACDGSGYSETSVGNGVLLVAATLTGDGTRVSGAAVEGSFAVTISYQ
jgi:hypothetical protein